MEFWTYPPWITINQPCGRALTAVRWRVHPSTAALRTPGGWHRGGRVWGMTDLRLLTALTGGLAVLTAAAVHGGG